MGLSHAKISALELTRHSNFRFQSVSRHRPTDPTTVSSHLNSPHSSPEMSFSAKNSSLRRSQRIANKKSKGRLHNSCGCCRDAQEEHFTNASSLSTLLDLATTELLTPSPKRTKFDEQRDADPLEDTQILSTEETVIIQPSPSRLLPSSTDYQSMTSFYASLERGDLAGNEFDEITSHLEDCECSDCEDDRVLDSVTDTFRCVTLNSYESLGSIAKKLDSGIGGRRRRILVPVLDEDDDELICLSPTIPMRHSDFKVVITGASPDDPIMLD